MILALSGPLIFLISTIFETMSFKNLDQESYNRRMHNSYKYALIMFGFSMVIFSLVIIMVNNMIKRYLEFIRTLSLKDTEKLFLLNEKETFYYKYLPSYIIKENTVTFFSMFPQDTIKFDDIVSINIREKYYRGYAAFMTIHTKNRNYNYTLSGNSFKVRNLLAEALDANPNILSNKN